MNQSDVALLMFKGIVTEMDEADRGAFDGACNEIRAVLERRGLLGEMALGFVMLEMQAKESGK
ncbi:hypothetical protein [Paraburkholderia sp. SIMBA_027]|uniref:hypothetical protein n=1 Tax=Paraburkholderia sp. SIMBA_027 TaxID=3085770 RepID=UPI003979B080